MAKAKEKNYAEYTHNKDTKVEMRGDVFNRVVELLNKLGTDEMKVFYDTSKADSEPLVYVTDKGNYIDGVLKELYQCHVNAVEAGTAQKIAPNLEMVK